MIREVTNALKKRNSMTKLNVISAASKVQTPTVLTTAARIILMTDINRLITSLKRRSAHAKEFGHDVLFVKLEDLDVLVESLELAQQRLAELERKEGALRPVGVMSEKAYHRLENRESRFIALWPRPEIYLPRKRPEDGVIVYARTAATAGIKVEAE
ncbi:hypothetical protein [Klebsiella aerogenes]|uniref:hypothetical protein n=1 Tax=Klebsiella aerogenes TaxID=548 RepID=UPI0035CF3C3B